MRYHHGLPLATLNPWSLQAISTVCPRGMVGPCVPPALAGFVHVFVAPPVVCGWLPAVPGWEEPPGPDGSDESACGDAAPSGDGSARGTRVSATSNSASLRQPVGFGWYHVSR